MRAWAAEMQLCSQKLLWGLGPRRAIEILQGGGEAGRSARARTHFCLWRTKAKNISLEGRERKWRKWFSGSGRQREPAVWPGAATVGSARDLRRGSPSFDRLSDALIGAGFFPEVQLAFLGVLVDRRQLVGRELEVLERAHVLFQLLGGACADQRRGDARILEHPCQRHLRQALAACLGDVVQGAHVGQVFLAQVVLLQGTATR